MFRRFFLALVVAVMLAACVSPPTPTPTPDPLPVPDWLDFPTSEVVVDARARTGGPPRIGDLCDEIHLRIWGDGHIVYDECVEGQVLSSDGYVDRSRVREILTSLFGAGFFDSWEPGLPTPAATVVPNPAGSYCAIEVNLKSGPFLRSWSSVPPVCAQLFEVGPSIK
jgi:hypothetical protein